MTIPTPKGYIAVEHDDGKIHAVDLDDLDTGTAIWRIAPVCGAATGVSSDEAGPDVTGGPEITCQDCAGILA